jgi:hypothetical protein
MYSGEYDACDVTLSVYPHRASLKIMPDHGGNRTYDLAVVRHNFQACPVWIYTQSNITSIKSYNDSLLFVYLYMLLQRFYSLILPNPGVQIAYNKYMSIYSG